MCSDAPDTRIAQEAALRQADISKEALDWYKTIYSEGKGDRDAAGAMAREQAGLQNEASREALSTVREERERYNTTFKPIEAKIASDALTFNSPERKEFEARKAGADMEISLAGQRQATGRSMERRGVMPGSGRQLAMNDSFTLGAAKLRAGAENSARDRIEAVGNAKLMDAAGLGRGVVQNSATNAQIGLTAGNAAVNNAGQPLNVANTGAQLMGQGFNTALQANNSAANINMGIANQQAGVDSANGQAAGAAAGAVATIAVAI